MTEVTEQKIPARDRIDTARLIHDFDVLMRAGQIVIEDGRVTRRKWSQNKVAAALGCPASHLSAMRSGTLRPAGNLALAIMGFLDANVNDYLLPLPEPEAANAA